MKMTNSVLNKDYEILWDPWIVSDMDRRLKIPHSAKVECGFRTTPEECLYDSGLTGLQYRTSLYNTILYNACYITFSDFLGVCMDITFPSIISDTAPSLNVTQKTLFYCSKQITYQVLLHHVLYNVWSIEMEINCMFPNWATRFICALQYYNTSRNILHLWIHIHKGQYV